MKNAIILLLAVFVLFAGCAGSSTQQTNTQPTQNNPTGSNAGTTNVEIKGFTFSPSTITVPKGATVTWTNMDDVAHTVTSDDGKFDSGSVTKGQTYSHTFTEAGTFAYHCTPHPNMKASVVVKE